MSTKFLTAVGRLNIGAHLPSFSAASSAIMASINNILGIADNIETRLRIDVDGTSKIGKIPFAEFSAMTPDQKLAFFQSTSFSSDPDVRAKALKAVDQKFVDVATRASIIKKSEVGAADLQKRVSNADGTINTTHPVWQTLMKSLATVTLVGAGIAWSLHMLNELVEGNSGCFLVGPNGEETRLGTGDCNCLVTDSNGAVNPYRQICCSTCKSHGDTSLICPGETPSATWTKPYACPSDPAVPKSAMRSSLSLASATAMARAEMLSRSKKATPMTYAATTDTSVCQSCGCTESWTLCYRKATIWSVLIGMAADVGQILLEGADQFTQFAMGALSGLFKGLAGPLMIAGIVIVVILGLGLTVHFVQKSRQRKLSPNYQTT